MKLMNNLHYISVESRKGGVGKTTVALSLAQCLIKRGYKVLLLDLDFSGTKLSDSFIDTNAYIQRVTYKGKQQNLIRLYKDQFLKGLSIPGFIFDDNVRGCLLADRKKCNYIESDIYDEKNNKAIPIEDPLALNDSYHAYWMMELIENLAKSFAKGLGADEKAVVILDNAPGYSSLENIIHNYLTKIGPKYGKFLLVSSIDEQDLRACRQTVRVIDDITNERIKAKQYYLNLKNNKPAEDSDSVVFEETWKELCISDGKFPEYGSIGINKPEITNYISIIINKVHRDIVDQLQKKDGFLNATENTIPYLNHLQYYFSSQLLEKHGIKHESVNGVKEEYFRLSGDVKRIINDDINYQDFKKHIKTKEGIRIFKNDWTPMRPLLNLAHYYFDRGVREIEVDILFKKTKFPNKVLLGYENEIEIVRSFINPLIGKNEKFKKEFDSIVNEARRLLKEGDGRYPMNFYTDAPSYISLTKPIALFCIAVYSMHVYGNICSMLMDLIHMYLYDIDAFEQLDLDKIDVLLSNVHQGYIGANDSAFVKEWKRIISEKMNAREMKNVLESLLDKWEYDLEY